MPSNQKITILNSRQGLYPCRLHDWIQETQKVLTSLKDSQPTIISSVGMSTWDIVTIISAHLQLPLELHIQKKDDLIEDKISSYLISEYDLNPKRVSFIFISENSNKPFQTKRDNSITASANSIVPISVRSNGNLEKLLIQHKDKVDDSYRIIFKKRDDKFSYTLNKSKLTDKIQNISDEYIIHWTKTAKKKWLHEKLSDYYRDILKYDYYPRKAIDSLNNIINLKRIFATPTHMPQNIRTVSFTSLSPIEMIPLFKWRSRYSEMSFEPYGIGIKRETALSKNIQEVLYYDKELKDITIDNSKIWLTQSKGTITHWETENEYRHLGNFSFKDIDNKNILLFTRYKKEADQLQKSTGIHTISFID